MHIWRYKENQRNYPGYHLSADAEGCLAMLDWLRSLKAKPEFRLKPATSEVLSVPNNQGGLAAYVSYTLLKLQVKQDADRGHFVFSEVSDCLSLECSQQQIECIIKGVEDIQRGEGDYCIGRGKQQLLWFWWYPHQESTRVLRRRGIGHSAEQTRRDFTHP